MQMYRGLPVITNQISVEEQRGVPHHLLAHIDPLEPTWTNGLFVREAQKLAREIRSRGKLPIVVGGTLYYVQTLLFEGSLVQTSREVAPEDIHFRSQEESLARFPILGESTESIMQRLKEVDPVMAERWHPDDRRKILRSLEIFLATGRRASDIYAEQQQTKASSTLTKGPWETLLLLTCTESEILKERLRLRVGKMVEAGLLGELRSLHRRLLECTERGEVVDRTRGIWQSIGYKQMEPFLNGELAGEASDALDKLKETGLEEINIATRQYARYQLRRIQQSLSRAMRENGAMDMLFLLDSTDAARFSDDVLQPAADICREYLAGEGISIPRATTEMARQLLAGVEAGSAAAKPVFKVRTCEVCNMSLPSEDMWNAHIKGRRHRRAASRSTRSADGHVRSRLTVLPDTSEDGMNQGAESPGIG